MKSYIFAYRRCCSWYSKTYMTFICHKQVNLLLLLVLLLVLLIISITRMRLWGCCKFHRHPFSELLVWNMFLAFGCGSFSLVFENSAAQVALAVGGGGVVLQPHLTQTVRADWTLQTWRIQHCNANCLNNKWLRKSNKQEIIKRTWHA